MPEPSVVVRYSNFDDLAIINGWLKKRGHALVEPAEFPSLGFMVLVEELPVAACFLRRCEGGYGLVEGLASNPEAPPEARHAALDTAIRMVIAEARHRELTNLIAWTTDTSALMRGSERHGFTKSRQILLTKNLVKGPRIH